MNSPTEENFAGVPFIFEIIDDADVQAVKPGRKPGSPVIKKVTRTEKRLCEQEPAIQGKCDSCGQPIRDGGKCGCS